MASALEDILARLEPQHARALEWFADHAGDVGPRPWRHDGVSPVAGVTIPLTAQRGIHKPDGLDWALSVAATESSVYLDGKPTRVDKDTWVLPYKEHSGSDGAGYGSRWNRALLRNMRDRIPVGVFVPSAGSGYLNLGLAIPESFDPSSGTFLLRGPVTYSQDASIWGEALESNAGVLEDLAAAEDDDGIRLARVRQRKAQDVFRDSLMAAYSGSCCVTRYDAPDALQGAHILSYSGRSSQVPQNGLLLRADIHLLFDRHLLSIEPDRLCVRVSRRIRDTAYGALDRGDVARPIARELAPDSAKLEVHWAVFERAEV